MSRYLIFILVTVSLCGGTVAAQIPVEVYAGNEKTTLDIMFFKYFGHKDDTPSRVLFFNRNRVSLDYEMSASNKLPQFGFTEAISYIHPKLKGFAPVMITQIFNSGIYPKAGIQYVYMNPHLTFFSWLVAETSMETSIDYYFLFRYTPAISARLNLFVQIESLNNYRPDPAFFQFYQRFRIGLKKNRIQFGLGSDLSQTGNNTFDHKSNAGVFSRYEF